MLHLVPCCYLHVCMIGHRHCPALVVRAAMRHAPAMLSQATSQSFQASHEERPPIHRAQKMRSTLYVYRHLGAHPLNRPARSLIGETGVFDHHDVRTRIEMHVRFAGFRVCSTPIQVYSPCPSSGKRSRSPDPAIANFGNPNCPFFGVEKSLS